MSVQQLLQLVVNTTPTGRNSASPAQARASGGGRHGRGFGTIALQTICRIDVLLELMYVANHTRQRQSQLSLEASDIAIRSVPRSSHFILQPMVPLDQLVVCHPMFFEILSNWRPLFIKPLLVCCHTLFPFPSSLHFWFPQVLPHAQIILRRIYVQRSSTLFSTHFQIGADDRGGEEQ